MGDLVLPAESESESVAEGKTRQLRDGRWSVQCKWCEVKKTEQADNHEAFYNMLKNCKWRCSMPYKKYPQRNWSCPSCRDWWDTPPTATDTTPTATDAAGSAGQLAAHAAAPSSDTLYSEVEQLKDEVEQLKAEVEQLQAEVEKWKELVHGHVQHKVAHVVEIRTLRQEIADLRAEFTAAQHPPLVSPPPGIE